MQEAGNLQKITIIAGHYGSGKTTFAVNYAMALRREYERVALCDMDIVNPYFRTADHAQILEDAGVELISSPFANTNVEMPWAPVEVLRVFDDPALCSVIDLGGDDQGAMALGRYAKKLVGRDAELWMVVNPYRPLSRNMEDLRVIQQEIEAACKLRFTGLVCNPNLGEETTPELIAASFPLMREISVAFGLPVVKTAVQRGTEVEVPPELGELFELECYGNRFGF